MHGPEEWRSRPKGRKTARVHRIRPIGSLHFFCRSKSAVWLNSDAGTPWRAPCSVFALLLACLGPLVPFPIETDLPAFPGIAVRCSLTGHVPVCAVSTPLVMHSTLALAATALRVLGCGLHAWVWGRRHMS